MFTISAPRMTIRFVALLTAVSLVLSAFPAAFFVANAQEVPVDESIIDIPVQEEKITVCHAAGQSGNYIATEVALSAVVEGHGDHEDDIIPPFGEFAGLNWNEDTEAIWNNDCATPEPVEGAATLIAHKIVCDDESMLPNWGSNTDNADITANTATDWVEEHAGCHFEAGWDFEWAVFGSTGNPGDTLVGSAGEPWTTFGATNESGMTSTVIPESAFEAGIWVREVLQSGYIPYTYNPEKVNTNDVSAEIYCNSDVVNYDNFDYVGGLEDNATYYCVAWNVLAEDPVQPMHEITGSKWNDSNGNGYWDEGEEKLSGWTIVAENEDDETISTTTDANGDYILVVPAGEWTVSEDWQDGWRQTATIVNGDYLESYTCSFNIGDYEPVLYKSLSSELLDVKVAQVENTCDFGNHYYFETITACKMDENKNPIAGWTMNIQGTETETAIVATTGENGCVSVEVDPEYGPWSVKEVMTEGWSQMDVAVNNGDIYANEGESDRFCVFYDYKESRAELTQVEVVDEELDASRTCTFTNKAPEKRSHGSSGTRTKNKPKGQVLGATTQCGLWLNDYMQKATVNDTYQVLKLQTFLTLQGFATPLTGIFDATTEANVKLFQAKYADTVIKPWFDKGIVPHNRPTGFVYKTTRWQINDIMCPGIEAYPSFEGENLTTNVLISR